MADRITINQGMTTTINFTAKRNGVVFDLTGYTIVFYIKKEKDGAILVTGAGVIVVAADGTFTVSLTSTETNITPGKYLYENWLVSGSNKYHLGVGEVRVEDTLSIPA